MDARFTRYTAEERFGRSIVKAVIAAAAAAVMIGALLASGAIPAAAKEFGRTATIDTLAAMSVAEPVNRQQNASSLLESEAQLYQDRALNRIYASLGITQTDRDLWLLEEVNMQNLVVREPASTITQTDRDLWLLEEVNMHHLIPWADEAADDARPGDWIWNDLQLFEETGLHHLLPPGLRR